MGLLGRRHSIRVGIDYRQVKSPLEPPNVEPYAFFSTPTQILNGSPLLPYVFRFLPATPVLNQLAVFVQDEWRLHPRLNLSLGLRWEVDPPPTEAAWQRCVYTAWEYQRSQLSEVAPQGTPLWKTPWFNFAPRLGAAWSVHNQPGSQTVIRFGGGAFFDSLEEIATLGYDYLGFSASKLWPGATIPFTVNQLDIPITANPPYTSTAIVAFPTHLQLPYTLEWNVSLQQGIGQNQSVTLSYVAAEGRRLIGLQQLYLDGLQSRNLAPSIISRPALLRTIKPFNCNINVP